MLLPGHNRTVHASTSQLLLRSGVQQSTLDTHTNTLGGRRKPQFHAVMPSSYISSLTFCLSEPCSSHFHADRRCAAYQRRPTGNTCFGSGTHRQPFNRRLFVPESPFLDSSTRILGEKKREQSNMHDRRMNLFCSRTDDEQNGAWMQVKFSFLVAFLLPRKIRETGGKRAVFDKLASAKILCGVRRSFKRQKKT